MPTPLEEILRQIQSIFDNNNLLIIDKISQLQEKFQVLMNFSEEGFEAITKILDEKKCPTSMRKWTVYQFALKELGEHIQYPHPYSKRLMDKYSFTNDDMADYCKRIRVPDLENAGKKELYLLFLYRTEDNVRHFFELFSENEKATTELFKKEISFLASHSNRGLNALLPVLDDEDCPPELRKWAVLLMQQTEQTRLMASAVGEEVEVKGAENDSTSSRALMNKYKISSRSMAEFTSQQPTFHSDPKMLTSYQLYKAKSCWLNSEKALDNISEKSKILKKQIAILSTLGPPGLDTLIKILNHPNCPKEIAKWAILQLKLSELSEGPQRNPSGSAFLMSQNHITPADMAEFTAAERTDPRTLNAFNSFKNQADKDELARKQQISEFISSNQNLTDLQKMLKDPQYSRELKWAILQCKLQEGAHSAPPEEKSGAWYAPSNSDVLMADFDITLQDMVEFLLQPDFQEDPKIKQVYNTFVDEVITQEEYGWSIEAKTLSKALRDLKIATSALPQTDKKEFSQSFHNLANQILGISHDPSQQKNILPIITELSAQVQLYCTANDPNNPLEFRRFEKIVLECEKLDTLLDSKRLGTSQSSELIRLIYDTQQHIFTKQVTHSKVNTLSALESIASIRQSTAEKGGAERAVKPFASVLQKEITLLSFCGAPGYEVINAILDDTRCPVWLRKWAVFQFTLNELAEPSSGLEAVAAESKAQEVKSEAVGPKKKRSEELFNKYYKTEKNPAKMMAEFSYEQMVFNKDSADLSSVHQLFKDKALKEKEINWSEEAKELSSYLRELKTLINQSEGKKGLRSDKIEFLNTFLKHAEEILKTDEGRNQTKVLFPLASSVKSYFIAQDPTEETQALDNLFRDTFKLPKTSLTANIISFIAEKQKTVLASKISSNVRALQQKQAALKNDPINTAFLTPLIDKIKVMQTQNLPDAKISLISELTHHALSFLEATDGASQKEAFDGVISASYRLKSTTLKKLGTALQNLVRDNENQLRNLLSQLQVNGEGRFVGHYRLTQDNFTLPEKRVIKGLADSLLDIYKAKNNTRFYKDLVTSLITQRLESLSPPAYNMGTFFDLVQDSLKIIKPAGEIHRHKPPTPSLQVSPPHESKTPQIHSAGISPFLHKVQQKIYDIFEYLRPDDKTTAENLHKLVIKFSNSATAKDRHDATNDLENFYMFMKENKNPQFKDLLDLVFKELTEERRNELNNSFKKLIAAQKSLSNQVEQKEEEQKGAPIENTLKGFNSLIKEFHNFMDSTQTSGNITLSEFRALRKLIDAFLKLHNYSPNPSAVRSQVKKDLKFLFTQKPTSGFSLFKKESKYSRIQALINQVKEAATKPESPQSQQGPSV